MERVEIVLAAKAAVPCRCFLPETRVLTRRGPVVATELAAGDVLGEAAVRAVHVLPDAARDIAAITFLDPLWTSHPTQVDGARISARVAHL